MKTSKSKIFIAIVAGLLAGLMTMSACSSGSKKESKAESSAAQSETQPEASGAESEDAESTAEDNVYDFAGTSDNVVDLGTPTEKVDAASVFRNMTYIPEMLCSDYQILGNEASVKQHVMDKGFYKYNEKATSGGGVERQITNLPYKMEGSQYTYTGDPKNPAQLYVMEMSFYDDKGNKQHKKFKYTMSTTATKMAQLNLEEILNIKYDETYKKITSYETAQLKLEYTVSLHGFTLQLGKNGTTVEMKTGYSDPTKDAKPNLLQFAFISENSPMIDHISGFELSENSYCHITFINDQKEDETSTYAHGQMTDSGLFTFSVPYATETKTYQYAYVYLAHKGLILSDGKTTYKYTSKEEDYKTYKMKSILGDDASTDGMTSEQQKQLVIQQNTILTELEEAFAAKNIKADIDKATGRVTMDSSILFATDSADLSAEGKTSLDDFLEVYTSVLLSDKNKAYVAKLMVEGHTDTNGDHAYNQTLSEKRAKTVADYCVGKVASLKSIIESKGYSYDHPIYNPDGSVNMEASRRVVFRFMLQQK